jgi:hypothetical protein
MRRFFAYMLEGGMLRRIKADGFDQLDQFDQRRLQQIHGLW